MLGPTALIGGLSVFSLEQLLLAWGASKEREHFKLIPESDIDFDLCKVLAAVQSWACLCAGAVDLTFYKTDWSGMREFPSSSSVHKLHTS